MRVPACGPRRLLEVHDGGLQVATDARRWRPTRVGGDRRVQVHLLQTVEAPQRHWECGTVTLAYFSSRKKIEPPLQRKGGRLIGSTSAVRDLSAPFVFLIQLLLYKYGQVLPTARAPASADHLTIASRARLERVISGEVTDDIL